MLTPKTHVINSHTQNFGLYGERVGTLSVVTASEEEAQRVESQVRRHTYQLCALFILFWAHLLSFR